MRIFLIALLGSFSAFAEVNNCDGVLTNLSCEQHQQGVRLEVSEEEKARRAEAQKVKKLHVQKESALHELRRKHSNAKREHGVVVSIKPAELLCEQDAMSIKDCTDSIIRLEKRIDEQVNKKKLIESKEELSQARKERVESTTVIIDRGNNYIFRPKKRRRIYNSESSLDIKLKGKNGSVSGSFRAGGR